MIRFLALALMVPALALAQVPQKIGYQGRLLKSDGTPEAGTVSMTFSLFSAASGGNAVWSETQQLALSDGYYATFLGTATPLPAFNGSDIWLELAVGSNALSPRQYVGSVPFALNAGQAVNLSGGTVNASSVTIANGGTLSIGSTPIINSSGQVNGSALGSHTHSCGDVTSGVFDISRIPTGTTSTTVALGAHPHSATDVSSGVLDIARLPTGTTATTVSLGNHTHPSRTFSASGAVSPASPLSAVHNFGTYNVIAAAYVSTDNGATYTQVALGPSRASSSGSGKNGALTVSGTQTIDSVRTSCTGTAGSTTLAVGNTTGFAAGDAVLVIQVQGTGAGSFEEHTVTTVGGGSLTLDSALQYTYTGGASKAVALQVPQYTDVTVPNGATLTASAWDGTTGGILAFKATGTVSVAAGGAIDVSGKGFRGGISNGTNEPYTSTGPYAGESAVGPSVRSRVVLLSGGYVSYPNGGGGPGGIAVNAEGMTGGGGGAFGTAGGIGVSAAYLAGAPQIALPYGDDELIGLYLGSGGGGGGNKYTNPNGITQSPGFGVGGNGGGSILIRAAAIDNRGLIAANGGSGTTGESAGLGTTNIAGGGGGGGSGGAVLIDATSGYAGTIAVAGGPGGTAVATSYGGWSAAPLGGVGGNGRAKTRIGGGYSLVLQDANTVRLYSSTPVSNAKIVVMP